MLAVGRANTHPFHFCLKCLKPPPTPPSHVLLLQLERERLAAQQAAELESIIARYRGPLLEASIDLEQRIYHLLTMTGAEI